MYLHDMELTERFAGEKSGVTARSREKLMVCIVMYWYELGTIFQSKAAELAGVSRQEFIEALNRFKVSPFQVTPEELAKEVADG